MYLHANDVRCALQFSAYIVKFDSLCSYDGLFSANEQQQRLLALWHAAPDLLRPASTHGADWAAPPPVLAAPALEAALLAVPAAASLVHLRNQSDMQPGVCAPWWS